MAALDILKAPYRRLRAYQRQQQLRGPRIMTGFARCYPEATFIQIGSNDGKKHDPLCRSVLENPWRGVMIEPVPYVFARLQANYRDLERVSLENIAVADRDGEKTFYYVKQASGDENLPSWYDELGSFDRDVILKHRDYVPDLESRLVSTEVPCRRFDQICDQHGMARPDLVHIDTEGYDFEIIKTIDLRARRPTLLIFEHKHLSASDVDACYQLLSQHGYQLFAEGADTWCADAQPADEAGREFFQRFQRLTGSGRAPA